jgi:uncharacterized protein YbjT (DUF2867 family)
MKRRIILAGATGLIGGHVADFLTKAGHDVYCIMRRTHENLPAGACQIVAPTDAWPELVHETKADVAISCLGTTMRIAGSKPAFAAIDFELVSAFASAAKNGGAQHFIGVSSVGAGHDSSNFYLSTKGKAEKAIGALDFARTDIMRPGLLRGDRSGDRGGNVRYGEQFGVLLSPFTDMLLMGSLSRYRSISAETVGRAIAALVSQDGGGAFIHENSAMLTLAR